MASKTRLHIREHEDCMKTDSYAVFNYNMKYIVNLPSDYPFVLTLQSPVFYYYYYYYYWAG